MKTIELAKIVNGSSLALIKRRTRRFSTSIYDKLPTKKEKIRINNKTYQKHTNAYYIWSIPKISLMFEEFDLVLLEINLTRNFDYPYLIINIPYSLFTSDIL